MTTRLNIRLSGEEITILEEYCQKTGATKTGAIRMLLRLLKDERLLAIVKQSITVD